MKKTKNKTCLQKLRLFCCQSVWDYKGYWVEWKHRRRHVPIDLCVDLCLGSRSFAQKWNVFCQSFYYRQGGSLYTGDNIPLRQYSKISKNFMLQELGFAVCKTELWIITRVTHKPVSSKPANPFPLLPLDCEMAAPLWQQSQTAEQTDFGVLWRLRRKRNLPE